MMKWNTDMSNPKHWMQTFSNRPFKFDEPHDLELDILDIVRPLCVIPRFAGHASFHLTVAEHSLVVAKLVEINGGDDLTILHALLHDAHEAFTGDITTPFKRFLCDEYKVDVNGIQANYQFNILAALGIPAIANIHSTELIEKCDLIACKIERDMFMGSGLEWDIDTVTYPLSWREFYLRLSPGECCDLFLRKLKSLKAAINAHG